MHLLLESHEERNTPLGMAVSLLLHTAVLGAAVLAYRHSMDQRSLMDEFVTYLVPPDRPARHDGLESAFVQGSDGARSSGEVGRSGDGRSGGSGSVSPPAADSAERQALDLPTTLGDSILTEIEVDSAVKRFEWSAAPDYPIRMLQQNIEGSAFVIYVVDTTGVVDTNSFKVVRATHPEFVEAVRAALPGMRFRPAILSGLKVRQLVQQNFAFKITHADSTLPPPVKPPL